MTLNPHIIQYNQVLGIIKLKQFAQARRLLADLDAVLPGNPEINRVLGFVEVLTGYPRYACTRWSKFDLGMLGLSQQRVEAVQALLPVYDACYAQYNQGIAYIQNGDFDQAFNLIQAMMTASGDHPLPEDFYRTYLLLLLHRGEHDKATVVWEGLPPYATSLQEMQSIRARLQAYESKFAPTTKRNGSTRVLVASIVGVLLMSAGVSLSHWLDSTGQPDETGAKRVVATAKEGSPNTPSSLANDLSGTLIEQKKEIEELHALLAKQDAEREKWKQHETTMQDNLSSQELIVSLTGNNMTDLRQKAAYRSYLDGLNAFRKEDYEKAAEWFKQSDDLGQTSYFSDDNAFYWSEALKRLNRIDQANQIRDRFLANQEEAFLSSPYRDDLLLAKGEDLLSQKHPDEARDWFVRILNEYPKEWTAVRAKQLLNSTN